MQAQSMGRLPEIVSHSGEQNADPDLAFSPPESSYQRFAAGGIGLLLLAVLWGAWVSLIGFQPCSLSSLLWR